MLCGRNLLLKKKTAIVKSEKEWVSAEGKLDPLYLYVAHNCTHEDMMCFFMCLHLVGFSVDEKFPTMTSLDFQSLLGSLPLAICSAHLTLLTILLCLTEFQHRFVISHSVSLQPTTRDHTFWMTNYKDNNFQVIKQILLYVKIRKSSQIAPYSRQSVAWSNSPWLHGWEDLNPLPKS